MNSEDSESTEPPLEPEVHPLEAAMDQRRGELSAEWFSLMRAQLVAAPSNLTKQEARAVLFESWMVGKLAEIQVIAKIALDRTHEPRADQ